VIVARTLRIGVVATGFACRLPIDWRVVARLFTAHGVSIAL
jgi:hypothetical protein